MATHTDIHQTYCDNWSHPLLSSNHQDPQAVSLSQIIDHGSISFGRFAEESLAWEKWSVFSPNRHQEELEKFKAPGLVAQKKAYFEEYYKKVRALKALQAEQQGTTQSNVLQDEQTINFSAENSRHDTLSKEDFKTSNVHDSQFLDIECGESTDDKSQEITDQQKDSCDNHNGEVSMKKPQSMKEEFKTSNVHHSQFLDNESGESTEDNSQEITDQQKEYCDNHNGEVRMKEDIGISSTNEPRHFVKEVDQESISSINTSAEAAQQEILVSDMVKYDANKPEDHIRGTPVLKVKGTVASTKNKTKLDCQMKKDNVKPSGMLRPSLRNGITGRPENSVSSKRSARPASNIKSIPVYSHKPKPLTEVCSRVTAMHASSARDKPTSSFCSKGGQAKAISNSRGLAKKLPTNLPVHAQGHLSVQSTSKEINITSGLKKLALNNTRTCNGVPKRSLESGSRDMIPKGRQPENQRPKVKSTSVPALKKSTQNTGTDLEQRQLTTGRKLKEGSKFESGTREIKAGVGRNVKSASSIMPSSVHRAPNPKLEHKKKQDANLTMKVGV